MRNLRLRVKIRDGVGRGLCGTCRSVLRTVDNNGTERVLCMAARNEEGGPAVVNRPIVECSAYRGLHDMSEYEAERLGWILEVKKGRVIGFKPPPKEE